MTSKNGKQFISAALVGENYLVHGEVNIFEQFAIKDVCKLQLAVYWINALDKL